MENLTVVEVPGAPDQANRFVTCPRLVYTDLSDIAWGPSKKGILRDKTGNWRSLNSVELNRKIVDDFRARVKAGTAVAWIGTARVVEYMPSRNEFKSIYEGPEETKVVAEPEVPSVMQAQDGTFRMVPISGFSHGVRGWALAVAHVSRETNQAYADQFNGATKLEVVTRLFSSPLPWVIDLVKTYKLADPSQIPQPAAPVVEVPLTAAEIEAIAPFDYQEFTQKISAAEYKKRYVMDQRFRVACDKMFVIQAAFEEKMRLKQESEATQESLNAEKRKYQREDENERFKTSGGV
jgi:hypothetical protein